MREKYPKSGQREGKETLRLQLARNSPRLVGGKSDLTLAIGEFLTKIGGRKIRSYPCNWRGTHQDWWEGSQILPLQLVSSSPRLVGGKSDLTLAIGEELTKIGGREVRSYPCNWRGTHQDWWEGSQILPLQLVSSSPRLVGGKSDLTLAIGEELTKIGGRKSDLTLAIGEELTKIGGREVRSYPCN